MFAEFATLLKVALTIMNSWELVMPSAGRDVSLKVNTIVVGPLTALPLFHLLRDHRDLK